MVQYVFTPWRDRHELLLVREQLYAGFHDIVGLDATGSPGIAQLLPSKDDEGDGQTNARQEAAGETTRKRRHLAVARVSMWMQRGNCPHMVESTALLVAAMLSDEGAVSSENAASSAYAIRAAYSAAFSRFVTGLLDGHQDKQRKQSMFSIAKAIGLPATFVELRHQSTHEQLPSLAKLRSAARKALAWIWDYYWKQLGTIDAGHENDDQDPCKEAVFKYLRQEDGAVALKLVATLSQWPVERVQETVAGVRKSLPGNRVFLKSGMLLEAIRLKKASNLEEKDVEGDVDVEMARSAGEEDVAVAEGSSGWSQYKGTWKAKPIGIV